MRASHFLSSDVGSMEDIVAHLSATANTRTGRSQIIEDVEVRAVVPRWIGAQRADLLHCADPDQSPRGTTLRRPSLLQGEFETPLTRRRL
jgi:hypothetical protein